jgi:uncharacterized protein YqjF (DUF2071 family)
VSAFPELNVRTYVRVGGTPGVYFFSLDAANPVAVAVARTLAHLPYYSASMEVETRDGWIHYSSSRKPSSKTWRAGFGQGDSERASRPAELAARYRPVAEVRQPVDGTLEHFLTERYCLFTVDRDFRAYRVDIHHPPWPLQSAEAELTVNTMADAAGIRLPAVAPLLHFAKRQDTVAWHPVAI